MQPLSEATRELMWNISYGWLMYVMLVISLSIAGYGVYQRVQDWKKGKADEDRLTDLGGRLVYALKDVLLHRQVNRFGFAGIFHSFIFYSFLVLVFVTTIVAIQYDFHIVLFTGYFYVILTLAAEVAGVLLMVGALMALYRRTVMKPKTLDTNGGDYFAISLVFLLGFTGFLVEGLRIAGAGDEWSLLSPVGLAFATPFMGISDAGSANAHLVLWWTHAVLAFGFIAVIPYTKFAHIITLPTNAFFAKTRPRGELLRQDLEAIMEAEDFDEDSFTVGLQTSRDFTWKMRLDFDACIECGRCEEVCPAYMAGLEFSPKTFIQGLNDLAGLELPPKGEGDEDEETPPGAIVGPKFDEEFAWHCRTCAACVEVCPARIDHVDHFEEVRRHEVVMQGRLPQEAADALGIMENNMNPFGNQADRGDALEKLGLPVTEAGEEVDYLYFIGCVTIMDPIKHQIIKDVTTILDEAGVSYGTLGEEELCCGDPARLMGQEYLFQMIAKEQVEAIKARKFKKILVTCPHCMNSLKNEYPQFGGNFELIHHTELIAELIASGKIKPKTNVAKKVTFHDPCYLGRYQNVFDAPRDVLAKVPGVKTTEMENHHEKSLCCGAGGGHYWIDIMKGERINNIRVKQADATGSDTIVTSCGFCYQMLTDSVKLLELDEKMQVRDISSVVVESLGLTPKAEE